MEIEWEKKTLNYRTQSCVEKSINGDLLKFLFLFFVFFFSLLQEKSWHRREIYVP